MKVRYSPRSLRDLEKIRDYICKEAGNRQAADRFLHAPFKECDFLAVLPERYPVYRFAPGWRMMPFATYLYRLSDADLQIGHVRHAARRPFRG